MAQHGREMGRRFARRPGPRRLLPGALREFEQHRDVSGTLGVVRDLAGARIGAALQDIHDLLMQRPATRRRDGPFDGAACELMPKMHQAALERQHALFHAFIEAFFDACP